MCTCLETIVKWKLVTEVTINPGLTEADKATTFPKFALSNCSASRRKCVLCAGLSYLLCFPLLLFSQTQNVQCNFF